MVLCPSIFPLLVLLTLILYVTSAITILAFYRFEITLADVKFASETCRVRECIGDMTQMIVSDIKIF